MPMVIFPLVASILALSCAVVVARDYLARPKPDKVLEMIADYALGYQVKSDAAYTTARYCLMDTLGCGFEALTFPACTKRSSVAKERLPVAI